MNKSLDNLRKEIDKIDEQLINILAKRMSIVGEIGKLKKMDKIPVLDKERWQDVISKISSKSKSLKISKNFIKKIFETIHKHSIEVQKR